MEGNENMTKQDQLDLVNTIICDLMTCKYLVSEIRIIKLLKAIAASPDVLSKVQDVLKDFNFEYEFTKAQTKQKNENGNDVDAFVLPKDDDSIVALVFCILYSVDNKSLNFSQFLNKYFYIDKDVNVVYHRFCQEVLLPFAESLNYLVTGIRPDKESEVVVSASKLDSEVIFADKDIDDVHVLIRRIADDLVSSKISENEKTEVMITANGFGDAMLTLSMDNIRLTWIGFKNTVKDYKSVTKLLSKIESYLQKNHIIS